MYIPSIRPTHPPTHPHTRRRAASSHLCMCAAQPVAFPPRVLLQTMHILIHERELRAFHRLMLPLSHRKTTQPRRSRQHDHAATRGRCRLLSTAVHWLRKIQKAIKMSTPLSQQLGGPGPTGRPGPAWHAAECILAASERDSIPPLQCIIAPARV